jgi:hypothetical protein
MSLSAAIAINVILDLGLIGFLAWMMAHPRHLPSHVSARDKAAADALGEQQATRPDQGFVASRYQPSAVSAPVIVTQPSLAS